LTGTLNPSISGLTSTWPVFLLLSYPFLFYTETWIDGQRQSNGQVYKNSIDEDF